MSKNITITSLMLVLLFGLSSLALADWSAPVSSPPTCTSGNPGCDAPLNTSATAQVKNGPVTFNFTNLATIGLKILGKFQMVDGTQGAGKVLTDVNGDGVGSWVTPVAGVGGSIQGGDLLVPLVNKSAIAYGESFSTVNSVGNGSFKVIQNNLLVTNTKYGFILLSSGASNDANRRLASSGLGVDNSMMIKTLCGDWGSFNESATFNFINIGSQVGSSKVSYQGTFIYNPTTANTSTVHGSWGLIPYTATSGQTPTFNYQNIVPAPPSGCTDGRGYYTIYIYEYDILKGIMDKLYAITGNAKHKFNDPLSSNTSLHNGVAWNATSGI